MNRIKCGNCKTWNDSSGDAEQLCVHCGQKLHHRHRIELQNKVNEPSFIDSLPPYARYIFLGLVAIVGAIVVLALA